MHPDVLTLGQPEIRGTDSNTLLRLYDAARGRSHESPSQVERQRAGRAMQRIAQELQRRKVSL
jgi:hypothetical protein